MENLIPALKKHLGMDTGGESTTMANGSDTRNGNVVSPAPVQPKRPSIDQLAAEFICKCTLDKPQLVNSHDVGGSCGCVWPRPSLVYSDAMSAVTDLKVPVITAAYLAVEYVKEDAEVRVAI